ncbi:MAG: adenylosuccinate lyase [Planctomycetota bacterium]
MSPNDTYTSPLAERNASPEMLRVWSPRHKFNTWRRIWLAVAEAQYELTSGPNASEPDAPARVGAREPVGPVDTKTPRPETQASTDTNGGRTPTLAGASGSERPLVTKEQVEELRAVAARGITDAEIDLAKKYERELRHDVMAHVHALGDSCPKAKGIIHLGMTSQDVVCNADFLILLEATDVLVHKVIRTVVDLGEQARKTISVPTLGFTHYQPAQPLTVGRRFAQWAHDLRLCEARLWTCYEAPRGLRGATGTQASFLALFDGDSQKVQALDGRVFGKLKLSMGKIWPHGLTMYLTLTTQTYPRVIDTFILADLASVAAVLHKIATDIRLLCNRKEVDEPFEDKQIGSSAMPYKRNPMRCERICGLTRFVMNLVGNAYDTAATQWLERTLDDSSNRRLSLPEAFLALDGALDLMHNVASGLVVHEATVRKNLMAELPFMATENILMACVKLGGDRQQYHELIRQHAQIAGLRVKDEGRENDLLERLQGDRNFWSKEQGGPLTGELDWSTVLDPMNYIGRSVEQTERFIKEVVEPLREQYGDAISGLGDSSPKV